MTYAVTASESGLMSLVMKLQMLALSSHLNRRYSSYSSVCCFSARSFRASSNIPAEGQLVCRYFVAGLRVGWMLTPDGTSAHLNSQILAISLISAPWNGTVMNSNAGDIPPRSQ